MPFKEFGIVSGSGLCLAVSPASVLGDKLLSADTFVFGTTRPDRGRWIETPDKTDYSGKGYGKSGVKLTVQKKDSEEKYKLTRIDRDFDFSFSFNPETNILSSIDKKNLKIRLLKQSIGENDSLDDDAYEDPISTDKVDQLFNNQSENKVKTLLLSLSTRRFWKKIEDKNFFSLLYKPKETSDLKYTLKIKYFKQFDDLKKYVETQVPKCSNDNRCEASKEGLTILDQDTAEFYRDPE